MRKNIGFKTGFNSVYYAKIHCPVCKEQIFANALICPNCQTDFTKNPYKTRTRWQTTGMKVVLVISIIVCVLICISAPVVVGLLAGFGLYGAGYVLVQKIQSFRNYHHK